MIPVPLDILPALIGPALILLALAIFMPYTGGREARRREAWARFDNLARVRGLRGPERAALSRWAQIACSGTPYNVLVRRKDFDRFARAEVERCTGMDPAAFELALLNLAELRRTLGFHTGPGPALSSHDLRAGERLVLRLDEGEKIPLRVTRVNEEGVHVDADLRHASRARLRAGWATFSRDAEGYYRFRTQPLRRGVLAHGTFLVHEERRRELRVAVPTDPFWVAVERLPDGGAPEDPEGVEVEILDVSVGGVALLADRQVRKGSELWLDLPLGRGPDSPRVRGVRARVLNHGYREGGGSRPHFCHCAWLQLADAPRRVLEAYVFSHGPGSESESSSGSGSRLRRSSATKPSTRLARESAWGSGLNEV